MAGLPGTGLGGLLYLLLVVLMPVREFWMLVSGRSAWARWMVVGRMSAMGGAIMLSLVGEWWLLAKCFKLVQRHTPANSYIHLSSTVAAKTVVPSLACGAFVVLAILTLTVHVLRLATRRRRGPACAPLRRQSWQPIERPPHVE